MMKKTLLIGCILLFSTVGFAQTEQAYPQPTSDITYQDFLDYIDDKVVRSAHILTQEDVDTLITLVTDPDHFTDTIDQECSFEYEAEFSLEILPTYEKVDIIFSQYCPNILINLPKGIQYYGGIKPESLEKVGIFIDTMYEKYKY